MAEKVDDTLKERGDVYGDYKGGLEYRKGLETLMNNRYFQVHGINMPDKDMFLFNDIFAKLSRLAVTPRHQDSMHDLAGYALLVEEVIKNEKADNITP